MNFQHIRNHIFVAEDDKVYAAVDRNLKYAVPRAIRKVVTSQKLDEYGKTLRDYYFKGATVSKSTLQGYVDVCNMTRINEIFMLSLTTKLFQI